MSDVAEQLDLLATTPESVPPAGPFDVPDLVTYREQVSRGSRSTGLESARRSDPNAFEGAIEAVRDAATEFGSFNADDVAWPVRGNEVGAAFAHLRRLGEIECVGYAVSRRPKAHGRLVRVWRGRAP